jgi:glycosyltransferase involved in cell wall biosynthesis
MSQRPAVTVCIPTYNRRHLLGKSLQSVLDQDFEDVEIIVSDNASEDDTAAYVASIDDPRLRYERTGENIGLFGNLSRCLSLGTGRYRVMLPDDDLMLPGNLARKVAFLDAHPNAGMVHSAFRFLDGDARPVGQKQSWSRLEGDTVESGESFLRRSVAIGGIVCVSSVMLRSDVVAGERFDAADGPYADLALWLRVASRSDVGFLDEALSGYLVHQSSASSGFNIVRVKGERHQMTAHHADAILQAHGRFVQRGDLPDELRTELCAILADADRRMRWNILANAVVPPDTLQVLKKVVRWQPGGLLHRMLAQDAARGAGAPPGPPALTPPATALTGIAPDAPVLTVPEPGVRTAG